MRTIGRTASTLDAISPDNIDTFEISNENAGMQMYKASITRKSFQRHKDDNFYKLAAKDIDLSPSIYSTEDYQFNPEVLYPEAFWSISPDIRTQVGGPDGFLLGDLRLNFNSEIYLINTYNSNFEFKV